MNIMKEKLMRFMYGRYGVDTFGKFLLWSGVILMLITSIFHFRIFYVIAREKTAIHRAITVPILEEAVGKRYRERTNIIFTCLQRNSRI